MGKLKKISIGIDDFMNKSMFIIAIISTLMCFFYSIKLTTLEQQIGILKDEKVEILQELVKYKE